MRIIIHLFESPPSQDTDCWIARGQGCGPARAGTVTIPLLVTPIMQATIVS